MKKTSQRKLLYKSISLRIPVSEFDLLKRAAKEQDRSFQKFARRELLAAANKTLRPTLSATK
jgi:uncharacterized protein (DUF1778 family)